MKLGKISILIFFITFLIFTKFNVFAEEKIQTVPQSNINNATYNEETKEEKNIESINENVEEITTEKKKKIQKQCDMYVTEGT